MKYKYIFFILLIQNFSFAQDARLFENHWYLKNLIIDGSDNFPPLNTIDLVFDQKNSMIIAGGTNCNYLFGEGIYIHNNFSDFTLTNFNLTLAVCPEISNYEGKYFSFFTDNGFFTNQLFSYSITESNNVRTLTVNSMFNKQAIYSSQMLSSKQYKTIEFSTYPNPASEFINVKLNNQNNENVQIRIYNNLGKLCITKNIKSSHEKIDIQGLTSGIYLIKFETDNLSVTKKIIKL